MNIDTVRAGGEDYFYYLVGIAGEPTEKYGNIYDINNEFNDIDEHATAYPIAIYVGDDAGPRSTQSGDFITFTYDSGTTIDVYFPAITGYGVDTFYVGADGSTYTDSRLCSVAYAAPTSTPTPTPLPWPMFHHDVRNTGRSQYVGPQAGALSWSYVTGDNVYSSPAIGSAGAVYVGSRDDRLYAFVDPSPTQTPTWDPAFPTYTPSTTPTMTPSRTPTPTWDPAVPTYTLTNTPTLTATRTPTSTQTPTLSGGYYYTSGMHTVNGLTAYALLPDNSSTFSSFSVQEWWNQVPGSWWSDVHVRHADGSETQIGSAVALHSRGGIISIPPEYVSETWECPETNLSPSDALKIVEWVKVGPHSTSRTFVTNQLGLEKLLNATWTFTRLVQYDYVLTPSNQFSSAILRHGSDTTRVVNISGYSSFLSVNFQPEEAETPVAHQADSGQSYKSHGVYNYGWQ